MLYPDILRRKQADKNNQRLGALINFSTDIMITITVQSILKDWPKNVVSQDQRSLVMDSITLKYRPVCQVFQVKGSLKTGSTIMIMLLVFLYKPQTYAWDSSFPR